MAWSRLSQHFPEIQTRQLADGDSCGSRGGGDLAGTGHGGGGGVLDRKGKLVSTLSLYRFVDLMEILYKGDQR